MPTGEEIITTPTHPFWVPEKGWTDAIQLRAGDRLQLLNGEYVIVEQVQHELLESPVTVYNFEVEDFHTYHVGDSQILVHNKCRAKNKIRPNLNADGDHTVFKRDANGRITNYVTYVRNSHIQSGFSEKLKFDGVGAAHGGVPTPHIIEHGKARPALPEEIPIFINKNGG